MSRLEYITPGFGSADSGVFERSFQQLIDVDGLAVTEIAKALEAVISSSALGPTERGRRIRVVLNGLQVPPDDLVLVHRLLPSDAVVRNAIGGLLPLAMRPLLSRNISGSELPRSDSKPVATVPNVQPKEWPKTTVSVVESTDPFRGVLLLGDESDHGANVAFLKDKDRFAPYRIPTPEAMQNASLDDVCAIVVARSWWRNFKQEEQEEALRKVCELSSLIYVLIDTRDLDRGAIELQTQILESSCSLDRITNSFVYAEGCSLTGADLANIERQSSALRESKLFRIEPAGLSPAESKVLRYAVVRHLGQRRRQGYQGVASIEIGGTAAGRSGNLTMIVYPVGDEAPFVVRLGNFKFLQQEFERIRKYVSPYVPAVSPTLHFEGEAGAMVYEVVADPSDETKPAPTFAARLRAWDASQLPYPLPGAPELVALTTCVKRTLERLVRINKRPGPLENDFGFEWIVQNLESLRANGIDFDIPLLDGRVESAAILAREAYQIVKTAQSMALSHGDVNLANVLVRDDLEPVLIDFQMCGAGHPLYDIWYFSAAVLCGFFRPTCSEQELALLLRRSLEADSTLTAIEQEVPRILAPRCNRFCIQVLLELRAAADLLLTHYNLSENHFWGIGTIIAAYGLQPREVQSYSARALMAACSAPFIVRV